MSQYKIRAEWPAEGLGALIKAARIKYTTKNNKTVKDVYEAIGVTRSYWYQIEDEVLRTISIEHLQAIEHLFGVSLYTISLGKAKIPEVKVIKGEEEYDF